MSWLGIDLGTSALKAVLVDDDGRILAGSSAALAVQRPQPGWSEQDPQAWLAACREAVTALPASLRGGIRGVGLAGQMHGATLLDRAGRFLRPAILWNDGRAQAECRALELAEPRARAITGNLAMPGFTAPKLLWLRTHEPEIVNRAAKILLPKDVLRHFLTGDFATDMSDASGTLWLDTAARTWSDAMLAATGVSPTAMPTLFEGNEATGTIRPPIAAEFGIPCVPVAAGAGDNAAAAIGSGIVSAGQALLSLGTSGVVFAPTDVFSPAPGRALHSFCHALPQRWHGMAVILSAASCLGWIAGLLGLEVDAALAAAATHRPDRPTPIFLPYLSGERTPHNDADAKGVFFGLSHGTDAAALVRAVLEGVAFALRDGLSVLDGAGIAVGDIHLAGGGTKSPLWLSIVADVLGRTLLLADTAQAGPAIGAARLARLAVTGEAPAAVCTPPANAARIEPGRTSMSALEDRYVAFSSLYPALRSLFTATSNPAGHPT